MRKEYNVTFVFLNLVDYNICSCSICVIGKEDKGTDAVTSGGVDKQRKNRHAVFIRHLPHLII